MSEGLVLGNLVVFLWTLGWAVFAARRLAAGASHSILFVMLVHFVFLGLPPLFDVVMGVPEFSLQPGFKLASESTAAATIYNLYVALALPFWWVTGRARRTVGAPRADTYGGLRRLRWPLLVLLVAPPALVLFAPDPSLYLVYGLSLTTRYTQEAKAFHGVLTLAAGLSMLAAFGLLLTVPRRVLRQLWITLPWLLIDAWLVGKRNAVALTLVLVGLALWERRVLRGVRLLTAGAAAVIVLSVYSIAYQSALRGYNLTTAAAAEVYENARIDYGRDAVVKMAMFAELNPDQMRILEYRGESLLFDVAMFVPRDAWPEKPLPYAQYVTSAMLLRPEPQLWGWAMTTSWLEEAIANFGWPGLFVGPAVISLICRVGDRRRDGLTRSLTSLVACLFLVLQLPAFWHVFALWGVFLWLKRPSKDRARPTRYSDPGRQITGVRTRDLPIGVVAQ